jgi:hypothetical protein
MDKDTKTAFAKLVKAMQDGFAGVEKRFTSLEEQIEARFAAVDARMEQGFAAVAEDIAAIKDQMATKDDLRNSLKPIEERLTSVESKIAGTNRRLDEEAMRRADLALPKRVSDLEEKTFGASRHPKHVPLR